MSTNRVYLARRRRNRFMMGLSLAALGFVLFCVTFVVLAIARLMLMQLQRREGKL